jgi:hypothetical protein
VLGSEFPQSPRLQGQRRVTATQQNLEPGRARWQNSTTADSFANGTPLEQSAADEFAVLEDRHEQADADTSSTRAERVDAQEGQALRLQQDPGGVVARPATGPLRSSASVREWSRADPAASQRRASRRVSAGFVWWFHRRCLRGYPVCAIATLHTACDARPEKAPVRLGSTDTHKPHAPRRAGHRTGPSDASAPQELLRAACQGQRSPAGRLERGDARAPGANRAGGGDRLHRPDRGRKRSDAEP